MTVTINGEERDLGRRGSTAVLLLATPALGLVLAAVLLCIVATALALPALAAGWALAHSRGTDPGDDATTKEGRTDG